MATRDRLHGIKWPSTNPRLLCVDFLTPAEAERITQGEFVIREEKEVEPEVEEAGPEEEEAGSEKDRPETEMVVEEEGSKAVAEDKQEGEKFYANFTIGLQTQADPKDLRSARLHHFRSPYILITLYTITRLLQNRNSRTLKKPWSIKIINCTKLQPIVQCTCISNVTMTLWRAFIPLYKHKRTYSHTRTHSHSLI